MGSPENPKKYYERLEFIGDRVLNLVVAEHLYHHHPDKSEGVLTNKLRFSSNDNLDEILDSLDKNFLEDLIAFKNNYKPKDTDLSADDLESFIGKLYLDQGLPETGKYVERILSAEIERFNPDTDYISRLQTFTQKNVKPYPDYRFEPDKTLPNNEHEFHVRVFIGDEMLGNGIGNRKSRAMQRAAKMALEKIG